MRLRRGRCVLLLRKNIRWLKRGSSVPDFGPLCLDLRFSKRLRALSACGRFLWTGGLGLERAECA